MELQTPLTDAGRVFKLFAKRLQKLNIFTLEDFLFHIPTRYEDYSLISKIMHVQPGEVVTVQGTVLEIKNIYTKFRKQIQKATIVDDSGNLEVTWFNQPFITRIIHQGDLISLSGKVELFLNKATMISHDYEVVADFSQTIHTGRLVPIYPETQGISSKWLRKTIYNLLQNHKQKLFEYMPDSILQDNNLLDYPTAIEHIHFPKSKDSIEVARERLSFDEFFLLHLRSLQKREEWKQTMKGPVFSVVQHKENIEEFWNRLPFTLTNAQKKAVEDIFKDVATPKPMNRLLEGDVGSGKTVVAAIAMFLTYLNGYQSVIMAPTEILANQHFDTISNLLSPFGVKVGLATGSKKNYELGIKNQGLKRKKPHNSSSIIPDSNSQSDILVGTHAVLSEKITFENLGLVIIDEQQRFGVEQRAVIRGKGINPHLLTMTATPIPRTVALTLYGELDVSYLHEMPKGRKEIKTWLVPEEKRTGAYDWIRKQIVKQNDQVFVVCPFIEESENMQTVKAAKMEFERLKTEIFPELHLSMLHGKMKGKEKNTVLSEFKQNLYSILVATPVVEVGIDISNATIIVIEASERFGLSQLHQLRGRVGRGDKQSYCLLFTESKNPLTINRLKAMESSHSGSELAELDLKLRGPGDIYGTMQHGRRELKVAQFSDFALIDQTKKAAENFFPMISSYPNLLQKLTSIAMKKVAPD